MAVESIDHNGEKDINQEGRVGMEESKKERGGGVVRVKIREGKEIQREEKGDLWLVAPETHRSMWVLCC